MLCRNIKAILFATAIYFYLGVKFTSKTQLKKLHSLRHDTQHNDTQYNDIQHNNNCGTQRNEIQHNGLGLSVSNMHFMLSVIMLNDVYVECLKYALYAECRYAKSRGATLLVLPGKYCARVKVNDSGKHFKMLLHSGSLLPY